MVCTPIQLSTECRHHKRPRIATCSRMELEQCQHTWTILVNSYDDAITIWVISLYSKTGWEYEITIWSVCVWSAAQPQHLLMGACHKEHVLVWKHSNPYITSCRRLLQSFSTHSSLWPVLLSSMWCCFDWLALCLKHTLTWVPQWHSLLAVNAPACTVPSSAACLLGSHIRIGMDPQSTSVSDGAWWLWSDRQNSNWLVICVEHVIASTCSSS